MSARKEGEKSAKKLDTGKGVGDMAEGIEFWQDEEKEETERRERIKATRREVEKLRKKKLDGEMAEEERASGKNLSLYRRKQQVQGKDGVGYQTKEIRVTIGSFSPIRKEPKSE